MMPSYSKTVRAFLAQEGTVWDIVDALDEEMPEVQPKQISECLERLAKHGIEKRPDRIYSFRQVGRYVAKATPSQRSVLRGQSVETVLIFARREPSPARAVEILEKYLRDNDTTRMNHVTAKEILPLVSGAPETRNVDTFDRDVIAACKTVLHALNMWQRGEYEPSVEALAQLSLIKPADLDAELAALIGN